MSQGRWTTPESPVTVEYDLSVMEEIRTLSVDGFHRLSRGGIDIGGVLFGAHQAGTVRIEAIRPVSCTYSRGPSYLLSEADRLQFQRCIESHSTDPGLSGLIPVGWYVSHTRSQLTLTGEDRGIFTAYFPHPWQVTLVLHPERAGATRAGFFVRSPDGELKSEASLLEFNLEPLRQPELASHLAGRRAPVSGDPAHEPAAPAPPQRPALLRSEPPPLVRRELALPLRTEPELPRFLAEATPPKSRKWRWLLIYAALLAAAGAGLRVYLVSRTIEPLALQAKEEDGEMRIQWNRAASAMSGARRGVLEITDNGETRVVQLSAPQLNAGLFPFIRKGTDLNVRLTVFDSGGTPTEEVTRYLGQPIPRPATPDLVAAKSELERLKEENRSLRDDLRASNGRVQQLDKRIAVLENLLRIERERTQLLRAR